jgi:hypothetical protein
LFRLYTIFQGYLRLGKCQLAVGRLAEAEVATKKALELEPSNKDAAANVRTISLPFNFSQFFLISFCTSCVFAFSL